MSEMLHLLQTLHFTKKAPEYGDEGESDTEPEVEEEGEEEEAEEVEVEEEIGEEGNQEDNQEIEADETELEEHEDTMAPLKTEVSTVYIPPYLLQSRALLLKKFSMIKRLEDKRIHDSVVNQQDSKWSMVSGVRGFAEGKNRYANILPYDRSRVRLRKPASESDNAAHDYINASKVTLNLRQIQDSQQKYTATQGPLKNTVVDFWEMVLYSGRHYSNISVVMVTPLEEYEVIKCFKYWVDEEKRYADLDGFAYGFDNKLRLTCLESSDDDEVEGIHYSKLQLEVLNAQGALKEIKTVHHFYYDQWEDLGSPNAWESVYQLSLRARSAADKGCPLTVHCSAGVGRTGTFIALDYLLNFCKDFVDQPDAASMTASSTTLTDESAPEDTIYTIVNLLRAHRMNMVQSASQFLFLYESALKYLENKKQRASAANCI